MYNKNNEEDEHNYSPNELAHLSINHKSLHDEIINSNLEDGDTIEKWQQRNLEWAQECLRQQRQNN